MGVDPDKASPWSEVPGDHLAKLGELPLVGGIVQQIGSGDKVKLLAQVEVLDI